jgi:hypothetical protein
LEEEFGKGIKQKLENLLADKQFQGTLEGQLSRIAIHLQRPVRVWDSGNTKSGILEDFIPPIDDGDKVIREGMIRVSLHNFQGSLTIRGPIPELFEVLSKARTFQQSQDFLEELDE